MSESNFTISLSDLSISQLARYVKAYWGRPSCRVKPYLRAMSAMRHVTDQSGAYLGREVIQLFLSNATGWRGPYAREIKAELKNRIKNA